MTAIAYRDGIMAADSVASGGGVKWGRVKKIVRAPDGSLAGSSGESGACERFRRWFAAGNFSLDSPFDPEIKDNDSWVALIVITSGEIFVQIAKDIVVMESPFHAIGSADVLMFGAMAAGATAEEAVRIAIDYDTGCGGEAQIERWQSAQDVK